MKHLASILSAAAVSLTLVACATEPEEAADTSGKADGATPSSNSPSDAYSPLANYRGLQTVDQLEGYRVECKAQDTMEMEISYKSVSNGTYFARARYQPGNYGPYEYLEDVTVTVEGNKLTFAGRNAQGMTRKQTITRGALESGCTQRGGWKFVEGEKIFVSGGTRIECKSDDGTIDYMLRIRDRSIQYDMTIAHFQADAHNMNDGSISTGEILWKSSGPDITFKNGYRIVLKNRMLSDARLLYATDSEDGGTKLTCAALAPFKE